MEPDEAPVAGMRLSGRLLLVLWILGLAGCTPGIEPRAKPDGWRAVWVLGDHEVLIHILSVRPEGGGLHAEYAAILSPRCMVWDYSRAPETGLVPDRVCLFRAGELDAGIVRRAASILNRSSLQGDLEVRHERGLAHEGEGWDIWGGFSSWQVTSGEGVLSGTLADDRFDAFGELQSPSPSTPVIDALIRPVLGELGVSLELLGKVDDEGRHDYGSFPRERCIVMLERLSDEFADSRGRRPVLIARAALGDHSWRRRALASDDPLDREAAVVSLGIDTGIPDRVGVLVSEMIRGPTCGVRFECSLQLGLLEADHCLSDGKMGSSIPDPELARLAVALAGPTAGDDWRPVASFLGRHGRREGLTWFLDALHRADPDASPLMWSDATEFIQGCPSPRDPAAAKEEWLRQHRTEADFSWDELSFAPNR